MSGLHPCAKLYAWSVESEMKITLITVCFNAEKTLATALESVARQKDVEFEYLVVDGGSSDGTIELIRSFEANLSRDARFSFRWISESDRGMYDAINKGIQLATGDVIGILNADDVLDGDDVLARIMREWAKDETVDCLYGNVRFVKELGECTVRVCFARYWKPWMLQWGYMPPHPGVFIRRTCFEAWGYYEPSRAEYRIAADYELLIRFFCVHRMKARYMPICTTVMRTGGVSTRDLEARKKLNEEIVKANRANGYFCIFPMLLPKYLVKIWEYVVRG